MLAALPPAGDRGAIEALVVSPDGLRVAALCEKGVSVRDGATQAEVGFVPMKSGLVALRKDGTLLVGGAPDKDDCVRKLLVWRAEPQGYRAAGAISMRRQPIMDISADGTVFTTLASGEGPMIEVAWTLDSSLKPRRRRAVKT